MASPRPETQRRWPARLVLAGIPGWLGVLACRLDDRVLSEAPGPPGGGATSCGAQGSTACETCLYRDCCEQAQACGEGSQCVSYLTCVSGCAGVAACVDACGTNSPSGYGDAVALSVCAQSECLACSRQTSAFDSCDATGSGACESSNDCARLQEGVLQSLNDDSCPECADDVLGQPCQRCLAAQTGLSGPCSSCMAQSLACLTDYCLLVCQSEEGDCDRCMSDAGCTTQLAACAFAG